MLMCRRSGSRSRWSFNKSSLVVKDNLFSLVRRQGSNREFFNKCDFAREDTRVAVVVAVVVGVRGETDLKDAER